MTSLEYAATADIIDDAVEQGGTGTEIAERARESARDIRELQQELAYQFDVTLSGQSSPEAWMSDLEAIADTVEETGGKIGDVVGSRMTDEIGGNVAGYAYQGKKGSTVIDVTAAMRPDATGRTTMNVHMLQDVVDHEGEHEKQAAVWNAEEVDIGNGQTLDRTRVSEVGAMSVQSSIAWVSADYREMYSFVTGLGVSAEEARAAAREGDLAGLGEEIRAQRGLPEGIAQETGRV